MPVTDPYPYVYVLADGSARDLHADERTYLETEFQGGDGAMPYIKDGKYKALGVASKSRITELPDVPAIADSFPDFIYAEWFAFVAPPKTSPEIATKFSQAVADTLRQPAVALGESVDRVSDLLFGEPAHLGHHAGQFLEVDVEGLCGVMFNHFTCPQPKRPVM